MTTGTSVGLAVTVDCTAFKRAIASLADIAGGRHGNTLMNCIRMKLASGHLVLDAVGDFCDLTLHLAVDTTGSSQELLIPAVRFGKFVAALPDAPVELSFRTNALHVHCAGVDLNVLALEADTPWLARSRDPAAPSGQVEPELLMDALRVRYALDPEHQVFKGFALKWFKEGSSKKLLAYTANPKNAAVLERETESMLEGEVVLHPKGLDPLNEFVHAFGDKPLRATVEPSVALYLEADGNVLRMSLLDARLPGLTQVLQGNVRTTATVPRHALLASLKRLECYAEGELNQAKLVQISTGNGVLVMSAEVAEGKVIDLVPARLQGDVARMRILVFTLIQAVQAASSGEITLEFIDKRLKIKDDTYTAVIMGRSD